MWDTILELFSQLLLYVTRSRMHSYEPALTVLLTVIWHSASDLSMAIISGPHEKGAALESVWEQISILLSPCLRVPAQKGELSNLPLVTMYLTTQKNMPRKLNQWSGVCLKIIAN